MSDAGVGALIVPSGDPHLSEYVHPHYERRAFVSGFTGSAGTVLVTQTQALLWTDGRYFLQAEAELADGWTLMRAGQPGVPKLEQYIAANVTQGTAVGIDPYVHSVEEAERLADAMAAADRGLSLVPLREGNLVDAVWASPPEGCAQRPPRPNGAARELGKEVAGMTATEKMQKVAEAAAEAGADGYLATALDEVAWLLNLRGSDVPHCPVLQAYVMVHAHRTDADPPAVTATATLFVDADKISPDLTATLTDAGVTVAPYEEVEAAVAAVAAADKKLMLDPDKSTYALRTAAAKAAELRPSPVTLPKAIKNEAELKGMLDAHAVDGAALANFFGWLFHYVQVEGGSLTEAELALKLASFRAAQPGFLDLSFPTIAGADANGAVIHYNPLTAADPATISASTMLLLDSGGQYVCGTTDVTRTLHLGVPSAWQRECFTRVLKGNIALDACVFPDGTPGMAIDAFARSALWQVGLDYLHGTGHGVGAALNVHEGPQSISTRYSNTVGLSEGMILSNEPGYYEKDNFGVRIENLLIVRKKNTEHDMGGKAFLCFEQLTHVPIQQNLIEPSLLTPAEVQWLDAYHARVWECVSPHLEVGSRGWEWLKQATQPLRTADVDATDAVSNAAPAGAVA